MVKEFFTNNIEETIKLGEELGKKLDNGDVILLEADLAGGKTTFTKGIGRALGVKKVINSPTFTICKTYNGDKTLYHLDLYRLDGLNNDFDLLEYFDGDGVCVVEWPFQVKEVLPNEYIIVNIYKVDENKRRIVLTSNSPRYDKILTEVQL